MRLLTEGLLDNRDLAGMVHAVLRDAVERDVVRDAGAERPVARIGDRDVQARRRELPRGADQRDLRLLQRVERLAQAASVACPSDGAGGQSPSAGSPAGRPCMRAATSRFQAVTCSTSSQIECAWGTGRAAA